MAELTFTIANESPCNFCNEPVPLQNSHCPACKQEIFPRYHAAEIYNSIMHGYLLDARAGGLILGRNHDEDDILAITPVTAGVFQLVAMVQGGEFILNKRISSLYAERLNEINSYKNKDQKSPPSIELTENTRIFNTNRVDVNIILLIDGGQFIVNRAATSKHYYELERLNSL